MIAYRICNPAFGDDIEGTGAKLFGNRWNSPGLAMLYLAEHISLAALEMMVHLQFGDKSGEFTLLHVAIPDNTSTRTVNFTKLKSTWREDPGYTQFIGNEFIRAKDFAMLTVPSAVIPEENNFLVNPFHPEFKKIKIVKTLSFRFDNRLFSL